jgi:hypothetical protein
MSDFVIVDGDTALFLPSFGAATVVVQPGQITGSGPAGFNGSPLCVDGDEASVEVPGCVYMTPQYSIPGSGTLKIDSLASDQLAQKSTTGDTALILKGGNFNAKFEVQSPAQQPPPGSGSPIPDSTTSYSGSGSFITSNTKYKAT